MRSRSATGNHLFNRQGTGVPRSSNRSAGAEPFSHRQPLVAVAGAVAAGMVADRFFVELELIGWWIVGWTAPLHGPPLVGCA